MSTALRLPFPAGREDSDAEGKYAVIADWLLCVPA